MHASVLLVLSVTHPPGTARIQDCHAFGINHSHKAAAVAAEWLCRQLTGNNNKNYRRAVVNWRCRDCPSASSFGDLAWSCARGASEA
ncbi:hypothetical protein [Citrobacter freundii]